MNHTIDHRLCKGRRLTSRADREAVGHGEPREHLLLGEALYREEDVGGRRGVEAGLIPGHEG